MERGEATPAGAERKGEFMAGIEAQARDLMKADSCVSRAWQNIFQAERATIGSCPRRCEAIWRSEKNCDCGSAALLSDIGEKHVNSRIRTQLKEGIVLHNLKSARFPNRSFRLWRMLGGLIVSNCAFNHRSPSQADG